MKKIIIVIFSILFFASFGWAQKKDSIPPANIQPPTQVEINKYVDSLVAKTSIKEFQDYLFGKITAKWYTEGGFLELYNYFVQQKIDLWIQERNRPKKK